jgi:hypothetical protein
MVYSLRDDDGVVSLNSTQAVDIEGIGAVKLVASPQLCRGKKVQFKADLSTREIDGKGAGLWLTAAEKTWHLTDGMYDSLISGTSDWQTFALVIDVPMDTTYVSYGMWMVGRGECRMKNAQFELVDDNVEVTANKIWDRVAIERYTERSGD